MTGKDRVSLRERHIGRNRGTERGENVVTGEQDWVRKRKIDREREREKERERARERKRLKTVSPRITFIKWIINGI